MAISSHPVHCVTGRIAVFGGYVCGNDGVFCSVLNRAATALFPYFPRSDDAQPLGTLSEFVRID